MTVSEHPSPEVMKQLGLRGLQELRRGLMGTLKAVDRAIVELSLTRMEEPVKFESKQS